MSNSATMRAEMCVNAKHASKRSMRVPTHRNYGEGR